MGTAALILAFGFLFPSSQACPQPPPLLAAVTRPDVRRVVEYEVIAANPLPWGRSVAVVTRVWGPGLVDRWLVSARRNDPGCPGVAASDVGTYLYRVGSTTDWASPRPLAGLDELALGTRFGSPRSYGVGVVDRVTASARAFPGWWSAGFGLVAWVLTRLRRRYR